MKANELMAGDYVYNHRNWECPIVEIRKNSAVVIAKHYGEEEFLLSELRPIPLTSEMLSELGFEKKGYRYGIYDDYFDFEMHEYNDGTWVASYHCCEMSLPDEQLLICYIHQLQHFMRHCGIEKTIEL